MRDGESPAARGIWRTAAAGAEAAFRFLPHAPALPPGGPWLRIEVSLGREATAILWATLDSVSLVASRREPGLNLGGGLDGAGRALALEFLFGDLVETIEGMTGRSLRVERAETHPLPEPGAMAALAQVAGVETLVLVRPPPFLVATLARFVARLPHDPHPVGDLGVVASLRVAAASLTIDELVRLRPGDGVVAHADARANPILVVAERRLATTTLTAEAAVLTSRLRGAQTPSDAFFLAEPDLMDDDALSRESRRVPDLTVTVVFEAGRQRLSIAELEKLDIGYRFAMPSDRSDLVAILVGGQQIGTGRLLDIEGGVVVEIVTLAP